MAEYIIPIAIFLVLGAAAGVILTIASRVLAVKSDETVELILAELPGINCGACGFSGCEGYAKSIANKECEPTLCKPGGAKTTAGIGRVLGIEVMAKEREVAYVHCNGNCNATEEKYAYNGTISCKASAQFYHGISSCKSGCMGFGDCAKVCGYDAIDFMDGIAVINPAKCTACGLCVKQCPNHLIAMRVESQLVNVACSSRDIGKVTRTVCKNGCIACKICEKKCPEGAIHVEDNHAVIDMEKCTNCGICVGVCPTKCIHQLPACVESAG